MNTKKILDIALNDSPLPRYVMANNRKTVKRQLKRRIRALEILRIAVDRALERHRERLDKIR